MKKISTFILLLAISSISYVQIKQENQYFIQESKTSQGSVYYVSHSENMPKIKDTELIFSSASNDILQQIKPKSGDQILFQSGDFFQGSLNIEAQGKPESLIKIGRFGKGNRPVLDGNGAKAVISLLNPAYFIIENLEIMNENGDYGILVEAKDAGELNNISIQDCEIHSVFLASKKKEVATNDDNKYHGGIKVIIYKGEQPSWWNGFVVQRNYIHNLGLCGFSIRSEYLLHKNARGNEAPYPSLNVLMENNIIKNIIRDGVIMAEVDGAIMQYNEVCRTGQMGLANGIWFWDAQNSVIQRNIGYECHSFQNDGGPFSIDYYSTNCAIQYNYSYNNDGPGMMAFGNHESGKGNLIKGNISYNDNRMNQDDGFATITILSAATEVIVEGNTVIAGSGTNYLVDHLDWEGKPLDVLYRNNKFYGNNKAKFGRFLNTGAKFEGNIFTNVPNLPENIIGKKNQTIFDKKFADKLVKKLNVGVQKSDFLVK